MTYVHSLTSSLMILLAATLELELTLELETGTVVGDVGSTDKMLLDSVPSCSDIERGPVGGPFTAVVGRESVVDAGSDGLVIGGGGARELRLPSSSSSPFSSSLELVSSFPLLFALDLSLIEYPLLFAAGTQCHTRSLNNSLSFDHSAHIFIHSLSTWEYPIDLSHFKNSGDLRIAFILLS